MTKHNAKHIRRPQRRRGLVLLRLLLAAAFCLASVMIVRGLWLSRREQKEFEALAGERESLAALHEQNSELFGWITIEDLGIDYPVMYSPERPQYYLSRDFNGRNSGSGTPFLEELCPPDGNYYLIYGHYVQGETVFGRLRYYADADYAAAHPRIRLETLSGEREYEIMAAFPAEVSYAPQPGEFLYYAYYDLSDPAVFEEFTAGVKAAALYDTGVTAHYGDELLTLSTCRPNLEDGRFAVVAKRIK